MAPPRPLVVTTPALNDGNVGEFYCCGNLFADGGVLPDTWSLVEGALPPGLELAASPGRITGTPTEAGSFTLTMRVTDEAGATADATLTIVISSPDAEPPPPRADGRRRFGFLDVSYRHPTRRAEAGLKSALRTASTLDARLPAGASGWSAGIDAALVTVSA